jgi:2-polyprenyl-3-methyl-5-hydroxy-6-metoxy-1,4-benzoquinol methylase
LRDICNNCGQTNLEPLYNAPAFDSRNREAGKNFGIARCRSCQLVSTTGTDADEVAEAYTSEYYGSASSKFVSAIERIISLTTVVRSRKIIQVWRGGQHTEESPSVLDIGCGRGQLLRAFQSQGASVLGLERQEFPADHTPSDILRVGSISDPEYTDIKFDIIILWHVLEHLEKLEELLNEATNHLSENGLLIIAVPNFSSLQQRMFSKHWFHLDLPRHLVHVDSKWLLQQLTNRGYSIEVTSYMDPLQNTFGFIQSALNSIAPRQPNDYYRLLKHGRFLERKTALRTLAWSLLSIVLLPFAILESTLGAVLRRGATVQVIARRNKG